MAFLHPSASPSIDIREADRRSRDAATAPGPLPLVVDVRNPDEFAAGLPVRPEPVEPGEGELRPR